MKYPRIEEHRGRYPTRWMCSALGVSDRGFRAWRSRGDPKRRQQDRRLLIDIRSSFERSDRTYGSPRILKDLREEGQRTSAKRIARIMQENGIVAVQRRRFKITTQSGHDFPIHPNLLDRDFNVDRPNLVWLGDITYIRTEEGWLYLAALMDLCSRRIVGRNTADRIDRWLTLTALNQAIRERRPAPGLIHHSDQGGQYAAYEYQRCLEQAQAVTSMSRKGDCWDNAPMESFFSTLKRERVHRRRYWTKQEATADIEDYIDRFYNRTRRHSQLGDLSPARFEASRFHT
jgi:transposase InsO family protein